MMKGLLVLPIAVLLSIGSPVFSNAGTDNTQSVSLLYLSFDADTYGAVSTGSIEREADCRFVLSERSYAVQSLRLLLDGAGFGSFSNRVVRLKASGLAKEDIYVDMEGGVQIGEDGDEKRLSSEAFTHMKALMEALAEAYNCDPRHRRAEADR